MIRSMSVIAALICWMASMPAAAVPSAEQVLTTIGFSADAMQQVLDGQFVTTDLKPTSERELAMALAFLVHEPPAALIDDVKKSLVASVDPDVIASGKIAGDGNLDDFAALSLGSGAQNQIKLFLGAKPGEDLNLSSTEISAFQALAKADTHDQKAVEDQLRKLLLARFQAYHSRGLDGVDAYDRGGEQTPAGGDLRRAVEAATGLKASAANFYDALLNYPESRPAGLEEDFAWTHYMAHGDPVFLLTHRLWMPEGEAWVMAQRQFYVTASYNSVQALAAFLPVDAGTLVVYLNRTSTDQVAGFGGSTKRAMGTKVMSSQIEGLFEKVKAAAEK